MASRRATMLADAWLTGLSHCAMKDESLSDWNIALANYLRSAGYPITAWEAKTLIQDYQQRGTLLV